MKYKIGDHVIIERSNIEFLGNFAGKSGTILEVDPVLEGWYRVFPDEWGEIVDWQGVWSKVKCLAGVEDSKYLNCKFMLANVPYDACDFLTKGKIYTGSRYDVFGKEQCSSYDSAQVIIIKEG